MSKAKVLLRICLIAIIAIYSSLFFCPSNRCSAQGTWYVRGVSQPYLVGNESSVAHPGQTISLVDSDTLNPILYFVPDIAGTPPPATVSVLVASHVNVGDSFSFLFQIPLIFTPPTPSPQVSDGLGDPMVITYPDKYDIVATSTGKHLEELQVTTASGTIPGSSYTYTGTATPPPVSWSYSDTDTALENISSLQISGGANVSFNPDSRYVQLHRDGAVGETTDSDGTVHGDTIYSITDIQDATTPDTPPITTNDMNWQVYEPSYYGNWGTISGVGHDGTSEQVPNATYTWSPNESQDTWDWGTVEAPFGTLGIQDDGIIGNPDSPLTKTITYTATSNVDGAQSIATYDITYHDPVDNLRPLVGPPTFVAPVFLGQNNTPMLNGGILNISMLNGYEFEWGLSSTVMGSGMQLGATILAGSTVPEIFACALMFEALGLTESVIPDLATNWQYQGTYQDFVNSAETQKNINEGDTGITMPTVQRMSSDMLNNYNANPATAFDGAHFTVSVWETLNVVNEMADSWNAAGFSGEVYPWYTTPDEIVTIFSWTYTN